jgi:hypothetical protein
MNIYYRVYPICKDYGHLTLILKKEELDPRSSDLGPIVRFLNQVTRQSKGILGLIEDHGSEYWFHTRSPVVLTEFGSWFNYVMTP